VIRARRSKNWASAPRRWRHGPREIQITALKREGCTTIRSEKPSGTTTANREERRTVLDFLQEGDVLTITRVDCLARSIDDNGLHLRSQDRLAHASRRLAKVSLNGVQATISVRPPI
jgi:DNA invertase Pin-like site-specific DNA recombinase